MFQRSFGSIPDLVVELIGHLRAPKTGRVTTRGGDQDHQCFGFDPITPSAADFGPSRVPTDGIA